MTHELTGTIKGLAIEYETGRAVVSFAVNDNQSAGAMFDELCGKDLSIKVAKFRQRRSMDANAYCWVLIGKLAEKLNIPKDEVYRNAVKQVGGNYEVVCVMNEAVDRMVECWPKKGLGWLTETMPSKIAGCTNVVLYFGSSTFDTASMSRLINIIVEDCKEQGIDTRTPDEIARMLSLWGENDHD